MNLKITNIQLKCILILLASFIVSLPQSKAQDVAYIIHKEEKDGLADRKVDYISRDVNGQFHIVTAQSIQYYDGMSFNLLEEVPPSFDSDQIQFVHTDSITGSSFIAQNNPLRTYTLCTNQLNSISIPNQITESGPSSDSVFISGNSRQLFYLVKGLHNQYKVHNEIGFIEEITLPVLPDKLFYDSTSSSFFGEWKDKRIKVLTGVRENDFKGKIVWRKGKLTLCNADGIFEWNQDRFDRIHKFNSLSDDILWAKADKKGNILIALHINVAKVNHLSLLKTSGEVVTYDNILSINDNIRDVYAEDFEDKMMLGTYNGLFVVNLVSKGIDRYWHTQSLAKSSFGAVITGVKSAKDEVYFTKEVGGLYKIDEGGYSNVIPDNDLANVNGLEFSEERDEFVISSYSFIGTGTISIFDIRNERVRREIPVDFTPLHISWKNKDQLFIAGTVKNSDYLNENIRGKLVVYDFISNSLEEIKLPNEVLADAIRSVFYESASNNLWLGTANGLYLVKGESVSKLCDAHIRMIKSYNGKIFVGSKGTGIYIYDIDSKELMKHLKSSDELTENSIISMEMDSEDNYWLGSFGGITVLDHELQVIRRLYEDEGLSNAEFNTMSSTKRGNKMYFGSINGLTEIESSQVLNTQKKARINFTRVDSWKNGKLEKRNFAQGLKFRSDLDSVNFHYVQPDFYPSFHSFRRSDINLSVNKKSKVNYRSGIIHFSSLALGNHELSLKAGNSSYKLEGTREINFKIVPYLVPWLVGLGLLCLCALVYLIFQSQKKKSEASLRHERAKFDKQLAEVELVALRAQMNPHFIFNALGAIQYFINTKDIAKADEYLSKFAKLMRSILESSKSKYIKLEEEIKMLELYTALEHIRFEEKFEYEFRIDEKLEGMEFHIPSMIIQPIVENAINHGLYHLDKRMGKLVLDFTMKDEDTVVCKIIDNGIGRAASANYRKKKAHKSRGMQIIKERIEALKKSDMYELEINYEDLTSPTMGTEVTITIHQKQ